ncbi:MAG: hypothetical protein HQ559_09755 [Lentisphaerae bacterium]|nr:hypothetical protein [Lentisphaerota bacterium]
MKAWTDEIGELIQQVLGNPDSAIEKTVLLLGGIVACVVIQFMAAKMLRMNMSSLGRAMGVMGLGVVAALAAAAAARLYLVPLVDSEALQPLLAPAAAIVTLFAVAAPAACLMQHGNYLQGVASVALAVAAALLVGFLVRAGFGAASQGGREMDKTRDHKRQIEQLLHITPPGQDHEGST